MAEHPKVDLLFKPYRPIVLTDNWREPRALDDTDQDKRGPTVQVRLPKVPR